MSEACCKCGEIAAKYGLEEYLRRVERKWPRRGGPSVRDIEEGIGERVLRARLMDADSLPVADVITALAEALTGDKDDVASVERSHAYHELQRLGLDPDDVDDDIPSYRTVDRHLTKCCGLEAPSPTEITAERGAVTAEERVGKLESRLTEVTEKTLTELATADHISEPGAVTVSVQAECGVCGEDHDIEAVIYGVCPTQTTAVTLES